MKISRLLMVLAVIGMFAINVAAIPANASSQNNNVEKNSTAKSNYFPATYDFKVKQEWLTMKDGVRLSATIYEPIAKVANERFPIVLEVLPYRKDDSFASRDYPVYSYFAKRGIMGVRVDARGMGSSEGQLTDREYSDAELNDIPDIIAQLAKWPQSNGNIGMLGKSWSAINGIITAMKNPPALKATLFLHGSEDLYANDLHTIDGGLHFDMFAVEIETENIMPRPPEYKLDDAYFRDRFNVQPWMFNYLHHQRDGKFWQSRSLDSNYASFKVPSYVIGGLLDGYRDFSTHMLTHLSVPMRGEMGPWNHAWPNTGSPGPNYEWRQTAVRWWQYWLNHKDSGIMQEPPFTVFMRGSVPPALTLSTTPGSFWAEDRTVIPDEKVVYLLQKNKTLSTTSGEQAIHSLPYQADSGIVIGNWWGETTGDVRSADEGGLVYDTEAFNQDKQIMGYPTVHLTVATDKPLADWVVRLEDVGPDGSVAFITGGLINASQKESRVSPKPVPVNQFFTLNIPMRFTTWTFAKGHKARLVVSNAQFPMIWPTPYNMTTQLKVGDGSSQLTLPFVSPSKKYKTPIMPKLEPIESAPGVSYTSAMELTPFRISYDKKQGLTIASADESSSWSVDDRHYQIVNKISYGVDPKNPAHATFSGHGTYEVRMGKRIVLGQTIIDVTSDKENFNVHIRREIQENHKLIKEREWEEKIPRDFQ